MISLLIAIIVLLVVVYAARIVVGYLALPAPITQLIYLAIGLIAFFYFLSLLGLGSFPLK